MGTRSVVGHTRSRLLMMGCNIPMAVNDLAQGLIALGDDTIRATVRDGDLEAPAR